MGAKALGQKTRNLVEKQPEASTVFSYNHASADNSSTRMNLNSLVFLLKTMNTLHKIFILFFCEALQN